MKVLLEKFIEKILLVPLEFGRAFLGCQSESFTFVTAEGGFIFYEKPLYLE